MEGGILATRTKRSSEIWLNSFVKLKREVQFLRDLSCSNLKNYDFTKKVRVTVNRDCEWAYVWTPI